jgi:hypothetical protein
MSKATPGDTDKILTSPIPEGANEEPESLSVQSAFWELNDLDKKLRVLRRLADNRDLQFEVMTYELPYFANLRPPTDLGVEVDRGLIKAIAAATLLLKSLQRAQRIVIAEPQVLDDIQRCIDRFLQTLPDARAHLQLHGADPNALPPQDDI